MLSAIESRLKCYQSVGSLSFFRLIPVINTNISVDVTKDVYVCISTLWFIIYFRDFRVTDKC